MYSSKIRNPKHHLFDKKVIPSKQVSPKTFDPTERLVQESIPMKQRNSTAGDVTKIAEQETPSTYGNGIHIEDHNLQNMEVNELFQYTKSLV